MQHEQLPAVDRGIDAGLEVEPGALRHLRHGFDLRGVDRDDVRNPVGKQADKLMLELLGELYRGKPDVVCCILQRDLYELLEKIIDRCRDVGNVVFQIVLKNS